MSFCSYVIKTPMSQIREDWNEFVSLVQRGRFLDKECNYVGKKLYINKSEPYGCIVRVEPQVKGGAQVKYCENFFKTSCDCLECPSVCKHNRYWRLMHERKEVITKKAEFWEKKFQNVK